MKKYFTLVLIFAVLHSFAQPLKLRNADQNKLQKRQSSIQSLAFENTLANIDNVALLQLEDGEFINLEIKGYGTSSEVGMPALPVKTFLIEIPQSATLKVDVKVRDYHKVSLREQGFHQQLAPAQAPVSKSAKEKPSFQMNKAVYQRNAYVEADLIKIEELGTMRNRRLAQVTISPVAYNPVENSLNVCSYFKAEIIFENADEELTRQMQERYQSPYFSGTERFLLNANDFFSEKKMALQTTKPEKFVIISDPIFEESIQSFIAWKKKKGFQVIEAYTSDAEVGTTNESIRSYIKGLYDNATENDPAPTFVLLIGDHEQIPAFNSKSNYDGTRFFTDLYYAEFTDDYLPDLLIGRFSAQNISDLVPQLRKTMAMEKLSIPDTTYLKNSLLIAGVDSKYGFKHLNKQVTYEKNLYFNEENNFNNTTFMYPASQGKKNDIVELMNEGLGIVLYTGHGLTTAWDGLVVNNTDINNLTNEDKYFFAIGNCCLTGTFVQSACLGETMLRSENAAVAYIGASESSYFDEDFYWSVGVPEIAIDVTSDFYYNNTGLGAVDKLFHTHDEGMDLWTMTASQVMYAGNLSVQSSSTTSGMKNYYWEIYHLFGDPSYMPYVNTPKEPVVKSIPDLKLMTSSYTLETENPYAYVAISKDGEAVAATYADANGVAVLNFLVEQTGDYDLAITGQSLVPYFNTISVYAVEGPYPCFKNSNVTNSQNEIVEGGRSKASYKWNSTIINAGNSVASNILVKVTTTDPYVKLENDSYPLESSLPSREEKKLSSVFSFTIDDEAPADHKASVKVAVWMNDNEISFEELLFPVRIPELTYQRFYIDDENSELQNNRLDPGEKATVKLFVTNESLAETRETTITSNPRYNYVKLRNATKSINLDVNASTSIELEVEIPSSAKVGDPVQIDLLLDMDGYQQTIQFVSSIGLALEDFETGDFTAYPWDLENSDWEITSDPAIGGYAARSKQITHDETTTLTMDYPVMIDDSISFDVYVSCERSFDYFAFFIDDTEMIRISGEHDWQRLTLPVPGGMHSFSWIYRKDRSGTDNKDMAAIDNIIFPQQDVEKLEVGVKKAKAIENQYLTYIYTSKDLLLNMETAQTIATELSLYNMMGVPVKRLLSGRLLPAGSHEYSFRLDDVPSGFYIAVLRVGNSLSTTKIVIP